MFHIKLRFMYHQVMQLLGGRGFSVLWGPRPPPGALAGGPSLCVCSQHCGQLKSSLNHYMCPLSAAGWQSHELCTPKQHTFMTSWSPWVGRVDVAQVGLSFRFSQGCAAPGQGSPACGISCQLICSGADAMITATACAVDVVHLDHPPLSTERVSSTKPGLVPQGGGHRSLDGGGTHSQAHGGYWCKLIPWGWGFKSPGFLLAGGWWPP